jgi:hypothetical protein
MAASIAAVVRRNRALGAGACRAGEVKPVPYVAQVQRLVAHRRQDAPTKRPVVGRMRYPQCLRHVALGQPVLARVIGHPSDAEGEFGGGAEQRPSDRVAVPAIKQWPDLSTQVLHGHWECDPAAMGVVDGLQAGLHGPDRFDVRVTDTARSSVPLHPPVRRE